MRWGFSGIIEPGYISSVMVSREPAGAVNGRAGLFSQRAAKTIPLIALFALRYGKICDSAYLIAYP